MLTDNTIYLRDNFPLLYNGIKDKDNKIKDIYISVEDTKDKNKTLQIKDKEGQSIYLHSKYNPIREAQAIINKFKEKENIDENTHIIFYGLGLGYHIDLFIKEYPDVDFSLYEPSVEIFNYFLENRNLKDYSRGNLKSIQCEYNNQILEEFLTKIIKKIDKRILIIDLPIYGKVFPEEYNKFFTRLKEIIKGTRSSIHTNLAFQKRWIINSMKNLKEVLNTPNILIEKKGQFKGKPAILVAAGPSLNEEIENIRYIKENGLAYIFSVGSAINTLIHHDIYPDAATTYDPTEKNQIVFEMAKDRKIKDISMIFGTSVGYETLENYLGNKYHMITSQDTVSNYFLKNKYNENIGLVQDAPSIAVVTLQLLYTLGFNHIILIGQNLAYRGKERHSAGVSYTKEVSEEEIKNGIWIKDVYGKEVLTNEGFNRMRQQMEYYIKYLPNIEVINTTKGGAHIEGTDFVELETLIENNLKERVVEENWLDGNNTNYDKEYLELQLKKMDRAYENALKINKEYNNILNKIEKAINNRNFKQAENLYIKLDKQLRKVERNDFYKTFILPMNRVQYKILADSIDSLNEVKDPYEKGLKIVGSFRGFISVCVNDMNMIEPIYEEMKEEVSNYMKSSLTEGE